MNERHQLLQRVADLINGLPDDRVMLVGIDGVDGAGKTTFANELTPLLTGGGRPVIRASVDGFHNPRAVRYRLGRTSPEGFFRESYDYPGLKKALLDPLSPGGSGLYRTAIYDHASDSPVVLPELQAPLRAILVVDGIFLHRTELRDYWDFSIFLDVAFEVSIPRGARRGPGFGSPDPAAIENLRYVEGQELYLRECRPREHATLIIDNNDLTSPRIVTST